MNLKLIKETIWDDNCINFITEDKDGKKEYYIEGIFIQANKKNGNGRIYPLENIQEDVQRYNEEIIGSNRAMGELGHPETASLNLDRAAILTKELRWEDNNVYGKSKVLDTPMGNIVRTLVKEGRLGISSRGLGTVGDDGYVNEDFNLITYDIVSDASNDASKFINGIFEQEFEIPGEDPESTEIDEDILEEFDEGIKVEILREDFKDRTGIIEKITNKGIFVQLFGKTTGKLLKKTAIFEKNEIKKIDESIEIEGAKVLYTKSILDFINKIDEKL